MPHNYQGEDKTTWMEMVRTLVFTITRSSDRLQHSTPNTKQNGLKNASTRVLAPRNLISFRQGGISLPFPWLRSLCGLQFLNARFLVNTGARTTQSSGLIKQF